MSYYAHGGGDVELKDENIKIPEEVLVDLCGYFGVEAYTYPAKKRNLSLVFDGDYNALSPGELINILNELCPYISYGNIEFYGESGDFWRFQYNPKTNIWNQYSGRGVFENETGLLPSENRIVKEALKSLDTKEARNVLGKYWESFS